MSMRTYTITKRFISLLKENDQDCIMLYKRFLNDRIYTNEAFLVIDSENDDYLYRISEVKNK